MKTNYHGVWPTMVTAFHEDGSLDIDGNKAITEYLIRMGSDGLFAVCQSSEMFFLSTEEKVALAKAVIEAADGRVPVIASGHTSDRLEDQIAELRAIADTGCAAVILVSNRLAAEGESSEVFLTNLKRILDALPDVVFGIYECPYPYRRLLTDDELRFCAASNRIIFLKDVSCDAEIEARRVKVVEGTDLKLFNANTETVLASLRAGYHGYNGVMGNFHIDLYRWLNRHFDKAPQFAEQLQRELTREALIETDGYPINAKYHMQRAGVPITLASRRMKAEAFGPAQREKVHALEAWEAKMRETIERNACPHAKG
ncbi:MAG: dihydrodipicolinate synthase family protein [Bacillota bacterium]|nr:dihydrodipicolinate synthase family protein [Bacillota bacterium]